MELAIIPPTKMLDDAGHFKMQLLLPHQLLNDKNYALWYLQNSRSGMHYILDNGAAEGEPVPSAVLDTLAKMYAVHEVAMPDVPGDMDRTILRYYQATDWLRAVYGAEGPPYKVGAVVQGRNIHEAFKCLEQMYRSNSFLDIVYIPRLLVTKDHRAARCDLAYKIHEKYPELKIHFFGMKHEYTRELSWIPSNNTFIRSIDTSTPYVYAVAGMKFGKQWNETAPHRELNYFHRIPTPDIKRLAWENIDILKETMPHGA